MFSFFRINRKIELEQVGIEQFTLEDYKNLRKDYEEGRTNKRVFNSTYENKLNKIERERQITVLIITIVALVVTLYFAIRYVVNEI